MTANTIQGKLAEFFKTSEPYVYKKGAAILRAGDVPSGVYYIESGFVKVYNLNLDGTENIIIILRPGEIFPGPWVHSKIGETQYDAITSVVLRRKTHKAFEELLDTNLQALREVHNYTLNIIEVLVNRIDNLELTASYARILNRLLLLAKRFGENKGTEVSLAAPITHSVIANSINMSRETASRELEKLKCKGLIDENNHIITIKDIKKLKNELSGFLDKK